MSPKTLVMSLFLLACLAVLPGCFILPMEPKGTGPATDEYSVDMEFIPAAQLVSEDTSPWWDLGRHAFSGGTDRLLVIGRTTAYADKDEDHEAIPGTMRDRKLERVWITIPSDIPLGKAMKLEELETDKITGYDVNNLDSKGFFKGPHLMKGFVNLVKEGPDEVVVIFDVEIRPNRPFQAENWKIEGKHVIPVRPDGRIATRTVSRDVQVASAPADGGNSGTNGNTGNGVEGSNGANGNGAAVDPVSTPLSAPTVESGNLNGSPTPAAVPVAAEPKPIAGKWIAETNGYEFRFQFMPDGKFIFAHTRGDGVNDKHPPGMNYGEYQIKKTRTNDWVVMTIDRCEFDGGDAIKDLYGENKVLMLKVDWEGDNMVLTGGLPILKNRTAKLVTKAADFPDMNKTLPPRGRRKNDPGEPNPKPYW